jgi:hypothetical protein
MQNTPKIAFLCSGLFFLSISAIIMYTFGLETPKYLFESWLTLFLNLTSKKSAINHSFSCNKKLSENMATVPVWSVIDIKHIFVFMGAMKILMYATT